ncbi:12988_t:CDS:2, partial [Gigaspora margarita]
MVNTKDTPKEFVTTKAINTKDTPKEVVTIHFVWHGSKSNTWCYRLFDPEFHEFKTIQGNTSSLYYAHLKLGHLARNCSAQKFWVGLVDKYIEIPEVNDVRFMKFVDIKDEGKYAKINRKCNDDFRREKVKVRKIVNISMSGQSNPNIKEKTNLSILTKELWKMVNAIKIRETKIRERCNRNGIRNEMDFGDNIRMMCVERIDEGGMNNNPHGPVTKPSPRHPESDKESPRNQSYEVKEKGVINGERENEKIDDLPNAIEHNQVEFEPGNDRNDECEGCNSVADFGQNACE